MERIERAKDERKAVSRSKAERQDYSPPKLKEWGSLRDLTRGGGGVEEDPFGLPGSFTNE